MLELQGHKVSLRTAFNKPDCLEGILSTDQGTPVTCYTCIFQAR